MGANLRETAIKRGERKSSFWIYKAFRFFLRMFVNPWVRLKSENVEVLNLKGPTILAPVHRSHLDSLLIATQSKRRIRALGKESLFKVPVLSYICAALGAIPVRRGKADRDAMKAAKSLLDDGESMIVFPEGSRSSGNKIGDLFDGVAWLAAKTGARVIPIGIAGTEEALPAEAKFIHRSHVVIVAGDPIKMASFEGKRASVVELKAFTKQLRVALQEAQDRAVEISASE